MYNEIREYLKDSSEKNRKRMAKAIEKNAASGTISDAAKSWLESYKTSPDKMDEVEKKLKSLFRCE